MLIFLQTPINKGFRNKKRGVGLTLPNGEKEVTYEVTYVDGREESREAKSETVIKEAVNQKVVMGSKPQGKTVISKQAIYDCDGSGHGYYIIKYSDGSVECKDF